MQIREQQHDDRGLPFVDTTLQDVRYGLRTMRRNPVYSLVAIATLAIGIGAGTAVFSSSRALPKPAADAIEPSVPAIAFAVTSRRSSTTCGSAAASLSPD